MADACQPDPCSTVDQFSSFTSVQATIATDGVIAFEYERSVDVIDEAQALGYVEVVVADDMGNQIPGALEPWSTVGIALWRPSTPLPPDTSLQVTIVVDNAGLGADTSPRWDGCHPDIAFDLPIITTSDTLPELVSDGVAPTSELLHTDILSDLADLVCCDGAYPTYDELDCLGEGTQWSEGHCATTLGYVRLEAGFEFEALQALDTHEDLLAVMVGDAGWTAQADIDATRVSILHTEPFCAHLDVWSLARGTRVSTEEVCFGEEVADMLGTVELDPSKELLAQCAGTPYVCTVEDDGFGNTWNMRECESWPPGGGGTSDSSADGTDDDGDDDDDDGDSDADDGSDVGEVDTGAATLLPDDGGEDSSGGGAQDGVASRGCACASDPRTDPTAAFGLLGLFALGAGRRHRRTRARAG